MTYHHLMSQVDFNEKIQFTLIFDNVNLNNTTINEKFIKNYYLLNNYCNCDKLLNWCKKFCLLPEDIIRQIDCEITKYSNHGKLQKLSSKIQEHLDDISHKNKIILETILENMILSDNPGLIEYTEDVQPEPDLMISEIKTTDRLTINRSSVPSYQMCTKNRGVLFFVNITHFPHYECAYRSGAQHDKFYLISLFRKFGYKIYYYENLLLDTFLTLVNKLVRDHLSDMESLVFVVESHGTMHSGIEFYYNENLGFDDILFKFSNRNCAVMEGRPKVFIFPCCRGLKPDYGISELQIATCLRSESIETDGISNLPSNFSDILICYATIHGFVTKRCAKNGNCYIEAFYRVLAEQAHILDLESMLYNVTRVLAKICRHSDTTRRESDPDHQDNLQTPSCVRWDFNKLLYFNPGYVE